MDDYYSEIASGYDELHGEEQDKKLHEFLSRVEIKPFMTLLDVGCGTGRSILSLECSWNGIEPSTGLIEHADPAVRDRIKQGVGEDLPYPDASFDVVLSLTALQNFSDPSKGVQEMLRVCKPNGFVLISFLKKSPKASELKKIVENELNIVESWEQEKDWMYVCRN